MWELADYESLETKQNYLRQQILNTQYDTHKFLQFMEKWKDQPSQNINLDNWSMRELQKLVEKFKKQQKQTLVYMPKQVNQLFLKIINLSYLAPPKKVNYFQLALWDFQMKHQPFCKKTHQQFIFKTNPFPKIQKIWTKQVSGLFGIKNKLQIWISITNNLTNITVHRKIDDIFWLRNALQKKFPGCYICPLEHFEQLDKNDKNFIPKKMVELNCFLKSILSFPYFVNSQIFYMFISEIEYKKFESFKKKQCELPPVTNTNQLQNYQGQYNSEITQRIIDFRKIGEIFIKNHCQAYKKIQTLISTIVEAMQTLNKSTSDLSKQVAIISQNLEYIKPYCDVKQLNNDEIIKVCNNLKHALSTKALSLNKQKELIKDLLVQNITPSKNKIIEFLEFDKKRNIALYKYLQSRLSLYGKKKISLSINKSLQNDIEKSSLLESRIVDQSRIKSEPNMYSLKQNAQQVQKRLWQAYLNSMYQKSFNAFLSLQCKQFQRQLSILSDQFQESKEQKIILFKKAEQYID